jgi:hypothetical protein
MVRSGLLRLKALLLAFILLNGGGGMPLLDAALYHRHGVTTTRVRAADDAQRAHAQVCHLGWTLPHATNTGPVALGLAFVALPFHRLPAPSVPAPRSADIGGLPQPRAPPVSLA